MNDDLKRMAKENSRRWQQAYIKAFQMGSPIYSGLIEAAIEDGLLPDLTRLTPLERSLFEEEVFRLGLPDSISDLVNAWARAQARVASMESETTKLPQAAAPTPEADSQGDLLRSVEDDQPTGDQPVGQTTKEGNPPPMPKHKPVNQKATQYLDRWQKWFKYKHAMERDGRMYTWADVANELGMSPGHVRTMHSIYCTDPECSRKRHT